MEEFSEPDFDTSRLSAVSLQQMGNVTLDEIIHIYKNKRSRTFDLPGYPRENAYHFCVGCSSRSRFLLIALDFKNGRYRFLDVKIATENEIQKFWCGEKK